MKRNDLDTFLKAYPEIEWSLNKCVGFFLESSPPSMIMLEYLFPLLECARIDVRAKDRRKEEAIEDKRKATIRLVKG